MKQQQNVTLLLLEAKAEWPTWGTRLRINATNSRVEVQQEHETLAEFHQRAQSVLEKLQDEGQVLKAAGYVCSTDSTQVTYEARQKVCLQLLAAMAEVQSETEMTLAGGAWASDGHEGLARISLMELWGHLSSQGSPVKVSVKFEELAGGSSDLPIRTSPILSTQELVQLSVDLDAETSHARSKGPVKVRSHLAPHSHNYEKVSPVSRTINLLEDEFEESGT